MQKRSDYKPRHVHRWVLIEKTPAAKAGYDWVSYGLTGKWHDAAPMKLRRECSDCGVRAVCSVEDESVLVPGYEAISGDLPWKEEV